MICLVASGVQPHDRANEQGPQPIPEPLLSLFQQYEKYVQHGQMADAESTLMQVMSLIAEHASTNPTPCMLMLTEAGCCEEKADWEGEIGRASCRERV